MKHYYNYEQLISIMVFIGICLSIFILIYNALNRFSRLPKEEQTEKLKKWLLGAVALAEKNFGTGTGVLKLSYVYDLFMQRFPEFSKLISFELFSSLVDEALEQLNHLIETNINIETYVRIKDW